MDGRRPAQMLIDTGCNQTVVLSRLISKNRLDHQDTVPILCTYGDTKCYLTAWMEFQIESWVCQSKVTVALSLPVDVLLGIDVGNFESVEGPNTGFAVITRSKTRDGHQTGIDIDRTRVLTPREEGQQLRGEVDIGDGGTADVGVGGTANVGVGGVGDGGTADVGVGGAGDRSTANVGVGGAGDVGVGVAGVGVGGESTKSVEPQLEPENPP